jgi:tetratricopeptide (TPR) repeat protein
MASDLDLRQLLATCDAALDNNDTDSLRLALDELERRASSVGALGELVGAVAALLVDAGAALRREQSVSLGLSIFEQSWPQLEPAYGAATLHYNMGNACKALYDIERSSPGWSLTLETVRRCLEAKSRYWRSLAAAGVRDETPEQLTNLGNALDACGRVVDALHYYDRAIAVSPKFGMAQLNRGQALQYLNAASGSYSIKMLYEIHKAYAEAAASDSTEPSFRQAARRHAEAAARVIQEHGHDVAEDPHSLEQDTSERASHDGYWRWCLDSSLTLSEHALYCHCIGARRDDLSILTPSAKLSGLLVPHMELLLNRVKSEYCLARALHYQAVTRESALKWSVDAFEGTYTDLLDGEASGIEAEFLRTSFRLCFGILDRIARGVCTLFDVAKSTDKLYFESFWNPQDKKSSRWQVLSSVVNPNLVALYGLAKDLGDRSGGQWSRLKRYRNLFEHELCLIRSEGAAAELPDWLKESPVPTITVEQMRADALGILRFTRAAMFHFAFLVRSESRNEPEGIGIAKRVVFAKKPIGKD